MKRALIAAAMAFAFVQGTAADPAVEEKYAKTCAICHAAGVAGAPKTGVPADWEPRLAKGNDVLLASMKNGLNAMPPKGMCMDCSDDDYIALIEYMAKAQ